MNMNSHNMPRNCPTKCAEHCMILDMPDDVLLHIFRFCDPITLCRLCRVSKSLRQLASQDHIWLSHSTQYSTLNINHGKRVPLKDRCRIAKNRANSLYQEDPVIKYRIKQIPCVAYSKEELWVSDLHSIRCFHLKGARHIKEKQKYLTGLKEDVSKFVVKNNKVVSGCRDGSVHVWDSHSGTSLARFNRLNEYDTQAVDICDDTIVSGSRDHMVKVVSLSEKKVKCVHEIDDRVWSIAIDTSGSKFACGISYCESRAPVMLFDLQSEKLQAVMGQDQKPGSGVLDMKFESPHTLLTCGYDTCIRLWDTRTNTCVNKWEDPFDSVVNCVQSDDDFTVFAGTARHGLVRIWDKRKSQPMQLFYTGRKNSPVYSLAFSHQKLFCALDLGVQVLDFDV